MRLLTTIAAILLLASCSKRTTSTTSSVRDSIIIKEVVRIDTVKLPGATVTIREQIECDSVTNKPKPATLSGQGGRAKIKVSIDSAGMLTATGGCDSLNQIIKALDREVYHLRHEQKKETVTVTEYKTRGIDKFCRWFTGISLLLIILIVVLKIYRII